MNTTLDHLLAGVTKLAEEIPAARPEYVKQLQSYLRSLAHNPHAEQKNYQRWYAQATKKALESAQERGDLDNFTKVQINCAFRMMEKYCHRITALPIVEEIVPGCVARSDGRIVKPYLLLPNNERIPLYKP